MYKVVVQTYNQKRHEIFVTRDENLLTACERNRVPVLCQCYQGQCGTCVMRVVKGEWAWQKADSADDLSLAGDQMLLCQAVPRSDLEIAAL